MDEQTVVSDEETPLTSSISTPTQADEAAVRRPAARPALVTVSGILLLVIGGRNLITMLLLLSQRHTFAPLPEGENVFTSVRGNVLLLDFTDLLIAGAFIAAGIGLLSMARWARTGAIVVIVARLSLILLVLINMISSYLLANADAKPIAFTKIVSAYLLDHADLRQPLMIVFDGGIPILLGYVIVLGLLRLQRTQLPAAMLSIFRRILPKRSAHDVLAFDLIIACAVALFTIHVGDRGLYLMDTGSGALMGWLISHGWIPFHDFLSPVPPLPGVLIALGYRLFGTTFHSSVIMGALLTAIGYLAIVSLLRTMISRWVAIPFALTIVIATIPLIGFPFYNHVSYLFITILSVAVLRHLRLTERFADRSSSIRAGWLYLLAGAIMLVKVHVGVLYLLGVGVLEWESSRTQSPISSRARWLALYYRTRYLLLLWLVTLVYLGFRFHDIFHNICGLGGADTGPYAIKFFTMHMSMYLDHGTFSFDFPRLTIVPIILIVLSVSVFCLQQHNRSPRIMRYLGFALFMLVATMLLSGTTAESSTLDISVEACALLFVYFSLYELQPQWGRISALLLMPLTLWMLYFAGNYAVLGLRKDWIEGEAGYRTTSGIESTYTSNTPFFNQLHMRNDQRDTLDFIYNLHRQSPKKRIFFGGELEMLYPATGQFPPKGWPLWLHPGISVQPAMYPALHDAFIREHYDTVIFSVQRRWMTEFLDDTIAKDYHPINVPRGSGYKCLYETTCAPGRLYDCRTVYAGVCWSAIEQTRAASTPCMKE